jgi:hypothetical protein
VGGRERSVNCRRRQSGDSCNLQNAFLSPRGEICKSEAITRLVLAHKMLKSLEPAHYFMAARKALEVVRVSPFLAVAVAEGEKVATPRKYQNV